jgi:cytochrome b involved in lipid metabolism
MVAEVSTRRRVLRSDDTKKKVVTWEELEKHASEESCWISIRGGVYDVTDWVNDHPGRI